MAPDTYLFYLATVLVFFAKPPGTSQLLMISNSIRHGLRKSSATLAGDLSANVIQMSAAAFGLATLIATSATAFLWIKWLGVAYLVWMGLQLIRNAGHGAQVDGSTSGGASRLFRQGFITSMANPYAVIFFGALFPQFIDPAAPVLPQLVVLGLTYLVIDGVLLVLWGWLGIGAVTVFKRTSTGAINKVCGALMMAAAALLASRDFQPQK